MTLQSLMCWGILLIFSNCPCTIRSHQDGSHQTESFLIQSCAFQSCPVFWRCFCSFHARPKMIVAANEWSNSKAGREDFSFAELCSGSKTTMQAETQWAYDIVWPCLTYNCQLALVFYHCKWLCWEVRRAEARVYWSLEHSEWHKRPKICLIDFDSGALAIPHKGIQR